MYPTNGHFAYDSDSDLFEFPNTDSVELADPDTLDRVNRGLLAILNLYAADRQNLLGRGLNDAAVEQRGYWTTTTLTTSFRIKRCNRRLKHAEIAVEFHAFLASLDK